MDPALWELLRAEVDSDKDREIEAIIRLRRPGLEIPGVRIVSCFGAVATCRIPAHDVIDVRAHRDVVSLKAARALSPDLQFPDRADRPAGPADPGGPALRPTDVRRSSELTVRGAGVVVGAVDWGVDVDAAAFRFGPRFSPGDDHEPPGGGTRFLAFWDQRDQASGRVPQPYEYGAVHDRAEIDDALRAGKPYEALGYHPAIADRGTGTHGTHVLDIAAGNGRGGGPVGIAPDADLLFVHLADRDTGGLANFGGSVRLLEAVDYMARTAAHRPWVINLSVGRHGGPHDGTTLTELAFDALLESTRGCFIVQSAGNYYRSRTHARGTLAAGEEHSFGIVTSPGDITPNELEIWYGGADEFAIRIDPPGCSGAAAVALGDRRDLIMDGRVVGRVYHRVHDPNSGDNHIDAFLDPIGHAGTWTVTLEARRVVHGRFDAWLERDDSCGPCQTRFTPHDADRGTTIGTIANGRLPLIVGAYDGHDPARLAASFSSAGPTRDGRDKPDVAAPGVDVIAARSSGIGADRSTGLFVRKSGTSMATPQVTGGLALLLELAGRRLSAREIRAVALASCSRPRSTDPDGRLGAGYLNIPYLVASGRRALAARGFAPATTEAIMTPGHITPDTALDPELAIFSAPATAYREYTYRPDGELARRIGQRYDVVAGPGCVLDRAPQPADLLIEVALGSTAPGRCVSLNGLELEEVRARGRLPHGRLILRRTQRVDVSDPRPVEPMPDERVSDAQDTELGRAVDRGLSENQITDGRFDVDLAAGSELTTKAAQSWGPDVRPAAEESVDAEESVQAGWAFDGIGHDLAEDTKQVPTHVRKARSTWTKLFGKDAVLGKVKIFDYANVPSKLVLDYPFTAWTNSATNIYVAKSAAANQITMDSVLHHEKMHIDQFRNSGRPGSYGDMVRFEITAYGQDEDRMAKLKKTLSSIKRPTPAQTRDLATATTLHANAVVVVDDLEQGLSEALTAKTPDELKLRLRELLIPKFLPPHTKLDDLYQPPTGERNPSAQESNEPGAESFSDRIADETGDPDLIGELFASGLADSVDDVDDVDDLMVADAGGGGSAEFSGPEHKTIGDAGSGREDSTIPYGNPPTPLSFGDVVSLAGDYFETYEQMRDLGTTAPGRAELHWARWRCLGLSKAEEPAVLQPIKDSVVDRYLLLAGRNLSHFSAGGTAWQAYTLWHGKAIADALEAGQAADDAVWRRALTKDAFGDHFLTDMFSAGHVRTPRVDIRDWYDHHHPGSDKFISYMAKYIFDRLDERQQLPPLLWWVGWLTRSIMADRIREMGGTAVKSFSLGDIVALALHDRDNKGLAVVSEVDPAGHAVPGGFAWTAVGDGHLHRSALGAKTKAMATAAVIASLRDLERVRGVGVKLGNGAVTVAQKTDEIRRALGGSGFAARGYVPRESKVAGANARLTVPGGARAPLEWRWGQLGEMAYAAVDETVKSSIASELHGMANRVKDPISAPLGIRVYGTRSALLSFVRHLRTEGIGAIERAVGSSAR